MEKISPQKRILVIAANCITDNSSVNLCNRAYLQALLDEGYDVELISAENHLGTPDPDVQVPAVSHNYEYKSVSNYEKIRDALRRFKKEPIEKPQKTDDTALVVYEKPVPYKKGFWGAIKRAVRTLYGVYGVQKAWYKRAVRFKGRQPYELLISISNPALSHYLAMKLLQKKRVTAGKWLQIWEDPWSDDLCLLEDAKPIRKEEARLLAAADHIVYVSPITCARQKELFPENAQKMAWQVLPYYYVDKQLPQRADGSHVYGHFGDFIPYVRDIGPFYEAAVASGVTAYICGKPGPIFPSTEKVRLTQRLPLGELKKYEQETDVLVFLCNLHGGQIPGKIYTYSATQKTILFILDGTAEEKEMLHTFFSQYDRYVFCDNTVESICRAIEKIESGQAEDSKNVVVEAFSPQAVMRNILHLVGEE